MSAIASPIATAAEAEKTIDDLTAIIEQLCGVVEKETALIHAGEMRTAKELSMVKGELSGRLLASGERVKANAKFLQQSAPTRCAALQALQERFGSVLQKNLIVLATSHAVSEGIVRRLSGDLAKKAAPQVYGASGRTAAPNPRHGQPLAVSRVL
jgi:hypothetical protein